jgi:thioredoxin 1
MKSSSALSPLNDETLKTYLSEKKSPLLVSFWAPWSSSSQILEQTLNELAHDYQKRIQISVLNIDENAHSPAEYGIKSIPHLLLFDQGEMVASFSGAQPKNKLVEIIESHLSS